MTTYIIESPNGETHKLEVFRTATGFSVYVDGSNIEYNGGRFFARA